MTDNPQHGVINLAELVRSPAGSTAIVVAPEGAFLMMKNGTSYASRCGAKLKSRALLAIDLRSREVMDLVEFVVIRQGRERESRGPRVAIGRAV